MAADPTYDPTEFQDMLRGWMERNALSQMGAAQTIGISQGIINRWLKPRGDPYLTKPTIDSLEKLAPHISGVTLVELKRMTDNLSPADREKLPTGVRDHRIAALLEDIMSRWSELDESERNKNEDVTRVLWGLHHDRTRRTRKSSTKEGDDSPRLRSLMPAWA